MFENEMMRNFMAVELKMTDRGVRQMIKDNPERYRRELAGLLLSKSEVSLEDFFNSINEGSEYLLMSKENREKIRAFDYMKKAMLIEDVNNSDLLMKRIEKYIVLLKGAMGNFRDQKDNNLAFGISILEDIPHLRVDSVGILSQPTLSNKSFYTSVGNGSPFSKTLTHLYDEIKTEFSEFKNTIQKKYSHDLTIDIGFSDKAEREISLVDVTYDDMKFRAFEKIENEKMVYTSFSAEGVTYSHDYEKDRYYNIVSLYNALFDLADNTGFSQEDIFVELKKMINEEVALFEHDNGRSLALLNYYTGTLWGLSMDHISKGLGFALSRIARDYCGEYDYKKDKNYRGLTSYRDTPKRRSLAFLDKTITRREVKVKTSALHGRQKVEETNSLPFMENT